MKIIQMLNRESIARYLKIILALFLVFCAYKIGEFIYDFWGFEEKQYKNAQEVLELFEKNEQDFNELANMLIETKVVETVFHEYMNSDSKIHVCSGTSLINPKIQIRRPGFLSDEDYKCIHDFFKNYGPEHIKGTASFYIVFQTQEGWVYLHYILPDGLENYIEHFRLLYDQTLIPLKNNWYYGVSLYEE